MTIDDGLLVLKVKKRKHKYGKETQARINERISGYVMRVNGSRTWMNGISHELAMVQAARHQAEWCRPFVERDGVWMPCC